MTVYTLDVELHFRHAGRLTPRFAAWARAAGVTQFGATTATTARGDELARLIEVVSPGVLVGRPVLLVPAPGRSWQGSFDASVRPLGETL